MVCAKIHGSHLILFDDSYLTLHFFGTLSNIHILLSKLFLSVPSPQPILNTVDMSLLLQIKIGGQKKQSYSQQGEEDKEDL